MKVKDKLYTEFTALEGGVSTNLRKAIESYLNHSKETRLTTVNHVESSVQYKGLVSMLGKHETDIQQLIADYEHVEGSDEFIILILKNISLLFHLLQPMLTSLDLLLQQESLKAKELPDTQNLGERENSKTRDKQKDPAVWEEG